MNTADIPIEEFRAVVGERHVVQDADARTYHQEFWGRAEGRALCVVLPGDTGEVSAVLAVCRKHKIAGFPQGGNALARALVFNPPLLILDEPLSALDKRLREQMQGEIRRIQKAIGVSVLCVTHDQTEAFVLSDRIAIMDCGSIQQVGRPRDIYFNPANEFAARFLGESNLLSGQTSRRDGSTFFETDGGILVDLGVADIDDRGPKSRLMFRPENIDLRKREDGAAPGNGEALRCDGVIRDITFLGDSTFFNVEIGAETILIRGLSRKDTDFRTGEPVQVIVAQNACVLVS